jgi:hypothetical protein
MSYLSKEGVWMSYLSKAEQEGYAALDRAKEGNHVMLIQEHFPCMGTKWQCACGASVAMVSYVDNTTGVEVSPEVDKPCPVWALRNTGPHTTQDDLDELFGSGRER